MGNSQLWRLLKSAFKVRQSTMVIGGQRLPQIVSNDGILGGWVPYTPGVMDASPSAGPANARHMPRAQLMLGLLQAALIAPNIPSAVLPALEALVARTAATGAGYAQVVGPNFHLRVTSNALPQVRGVEIRPEFSLSVEAALVQTLAQARSPLFVNDTRRLEGTENLSRLGIVALAAAPFTSLDGKLLGAFLMYTPKRHRWGARERELFGAVAETLGTLVARLLAEEDAIRALGMAVESRDPEVAGHVERVTRLAERVGRGLGLDEATLGALRRGAYLHDLGKVGTPDAILHKRGPLNAEERRVMQQHAEAGQLVAQQLAFVPQAVLDTILYHHERWDGGGYPRGLQGDDIPHTARVFAVCDVYDALTSVRPYKPAWSHEQALAEIRAQAGKQFDPRVVEVFLAVQDGGIATRYI